ncbi:hypothetical protein AB4Y32_07655 [Paraburkholderia phymatum]|uniref:Uncharacterized protein n=1 Tax=Paraburkholderia phymatum TaxID=148447 RepID=A0ACC6TWI3_9BURK
MTFRPTPAPLRWPQQSGGGGFGSGGGGTVWAAFRNAGPGPLVWDGEPVLRGPYDPSTVEAQLKAARAALSASGGDNDSGGDDGGSLLGVAGAVLSGGSDPDDDGEGTPDMVESLTDGSDPDDDASTPLSDAQPFDYQPNTPSDGDVDELAGGEGTPRNNQAQNKQTNDVARILGLTPSQSWRLHDEISGEGLGFHDLMERAKDMFDLW